MDEERDERGGEGGGQPGIRPLAGAPINRGGRPPSLVPDEKTLAFVYECALRGLPKTETARLLNVSTDTFAAFLNREPAAMQRWNDGTRAKNELRAAARTAAVTAVPSHAAPKNGEPCPTCGQKVGADNDTITLTVAELAEARRKFENLIDRHIAARRTASDAG